MTVTLDDRFKLRRGTAANLAAVNEVPFQGEIVYETDQGLADGKYKVKIGDGVTHYNDLPYMQLGGGVESVVPGGGIDVDASDPKNPIVSSTLGSISLSGRVATYPALPSGLGSGGAGKAYYVEADGLVYIWSGTAFPASGLGVAVSQGAFSVLAKWEFSLTGAQTAPLEASIQSFNEIFIVVDNVTAAASSYRALQYSNDNGATWKTSYSFENYTGAFGTSSLVCAAMHTTPTAAAVYCFANLKLMPSGPSRMDTSQNLAGTAGIQFVVPPLSPRINRIRVHSWAGAGAQSNLTGGSVFIYGR